MIERLQSELAAAERDLQNHMASWEYAWAMGDGCANDGALSRFVVTRDHTDFLRQRIRNLRAQISEYVV